MKRSSSRGARRCPARARSSPGWRARPGCRSSSAGRWPSRSRSRRWRGRRSRAAAGRGGRRPGGRSARRRRRGSRGSRRSPRRCGGRRRSCCRAAPRRAGRAGGGRRPATPSAARTGGSSASAAACARPRQGRSGRSRDTCSSADWVSEPAILWTLVSIASAPSVSALGGSSRVEAEVRAPGLVDDQRHARRVGDLRAALDVGCHPVVGGGDDEHGARARGGLQRRRAATPASPRAPCRARARTPAPPTSAARRRARARRSPTRGRCAARPPARRAAPARGTARGCPASRRWSETTSAPRRRPRPRAPPRARTASGTAPRSTPWMSCGMSSRRVCQPNAVRTPRSAPLPALWPGTWKRVAPRNPYATTAFEVRGRSAGRERPCRQRQHGTMRAVVITREYVDVPVGERAMRTFVAAPPPPAPSPASSSTPTSSS